MVGVAQTSILRTGFLIGVFVVSIFWAERARAIPSPELVIGSVSSLSQLFALGAAILGGGAVLAGARTKRRAALARRQVQLRWAAVGLFGFFLLSAWVNYWQYSQSQSTRLEHLQATLVRPAQFDGTEIKDTALKEISFSAQRDNRLSITTQEAAVLLTKMRTGNSNALLLDVRERGENQMGTLPMSTHIRFPDLQQNTAGMAGRQVVLFCHNGNRSAESCERLAEQGIDCRFIAGGIEKWIVEGREYTDDSVRGLSDLRAIPDYPNRDVLLDTKQVKTLLNNEGIQFIDVRYPGDFANQHLPGAINLPLRALSTPDLEAAFDALLDKPFIAACYDRRSCFFSQVLGLELANRGYDYRGRYTVPWEYFVPTPPKPHVAAWIAETQKTPWQRAVHLLADALSWVAGRSHIVFATVVLALISRLLILPISVKAERDQIKLATVKSELNHLKTELKGDPTRMSRAIRAFYRRHGLTPMRNLLALVFLPLMMLGLAAVQLAAKSQHGGYLWMEDLGQPDPLWLLPLAFSVLAGLYLDRVLASTARQRWLCWLVGGPILFALVFRLSALGNIYLCCALGLLLIQRGITNGAAIRSLKMLDHRVQGWKITHLHKGIIPLRATGHLGGCGNKALRLSQLLKAGVDAPDGVVLNGEFLRRFSRADNRVQEQLLNRIWKMTGQVPLAVRSSATAEDGGNQSFAGVYESHLSVDRARLGQAINQVHASFLADRTTSYAANDTDGGYNILIQQMVDADYAGVLFTRDPQAAGMMMLEYVPGTADDLVSGRVTPTTLRISRTVGSTEADSPIDLRALRELGMNAERLFGAPQDIEWVSSGGRLQLVQSRDITASSATGHDAVQVQREWVRLTDRFGVGPDDEVILEMDEMSEVLPKPTPLSLSYMQQIWAPGGSVDLACRRLGLHYMARENAPSQLTTVFGRLYSDAVVKTHNAVILNAVAVRRLKRADATIEQDYRQVFLPEFEKKLQLWNALKFSHLDRSAALDQLAEIYQEFLHWTHVEIEMINIAASYFSDEARLACTQKGLNSQDFMGGQAGFSAAGLMQQAADIPDDPRRQWLHEQMGHRSVCDYELSEPRYSEIPGMLDQLLCQNLIEADNNHETRKTTVPDASLRNKIETAHRYQSLKEEAKHHALKHLGVIRRAARALDRFLGSEGLVFFLTFEDLLSLTDEVETVLALARERRDRYRLFSKAPPLPPSLTRAELEQASNPFSEQAMYAKSAAASWVSGRGPISGRAYVAAADQAHAGGKLSGFKPGDILLCEMVHPAWLPHVLQAGAVISNVGGWLSHMAIVAREYSVPMLVGASGLQNIVSGTRVQIEADGIVTPASDTPDPDTDHETQKSQGRL